MAGLHQPLLFLLLLIFSLAQTDPLRSQIVGGREAKPHSRPYMAYLKDSNGYSCGGFLVAPRWVMTEAHCKGNYRVTLGAHNISFKEASHQVFSVVDNYKHPEYNTNTKSNDIRLLKLNSPAILNEYVKVLPLPKSSRDLSDGTPCSVAGWGRVYKDWKPVTLYETNLTIYDRRQCKQFYENLDYGKLCTGRHEKPEDPYKGDSGGPLVCDGVAEGIVSYSKPCPPEVYARVAHYRLWIKKVMRS